VVEELLAAGTLIAVLHRQLPNGAEELVGLDVGLLLGDGDDELRGVEDGEPRGCPEW
jgi:hypothetical protein